MNSTEDSSLFFLSPAYVAALPESSPHFILWGRQSHRSPKVTPLPLAPAPLPLNSPTYLDLQQQF